MKLYTLASYTNGEVHENEVRLREPNNIRLAMKNDIEMVNNYAASLDMHVVTLTFVVRPE